MGVFSLREGTGKTDFEKGGGGGGREAGTQAPPPLAHDRPTDEAADYFESFKCLSLLLLLLRFLIHICRGRGRARPAPAAAAPHSACAEARGECGEDFDEDSF